MHEHKGCTKRIIMFKVHGSLLHPTSLHSILYCSILRAY